MLLCLKTCSSVENKISFPGDLREIYGICLSNISRCSNPLHIDISCGFDNYPLNLFNPWSNKSHADLADNADSYFQRKHKEKYKFPLVISTFLRYFQRKHKEKHTFPLVIETFLLYLQRKSD